jgi:uncharacterized protein
MVVKEEILKRANDFNSLCQSYKVKSLYAFGSSTNDSFNSESSDIDLLVEIEYLDPIERGEKLMSFWDQLEGFFNRKVDLLTESSLRNPFLKKSIDSTKVLIYDGSRQKILI